MLFEKQIINAYRQMAYTRCDGDGCTHYFSSDDFPGLKKEPYPFTATAGHRLSGYIYSYPDKSNGRLAVFDHGFGGGHLAYITEIAMLCDRGYTVVAYDHTGCMESGGETPNGMAQSLADLNDCMNQIKRDGRFDGMDISVVGHSWGAFSTMNIAALHPEVRRIVAISGFVSVELLINSYFGGILMGYRKPIMRIESEANPEFVRYNAVESLKRSGVKALLIYSDDDRLCRKKVHYEALRKGLDGCEGVELMLVSGKGHNPNYTADAVAYLGEYLAKKAELTKSGALNDEGARADFVASFDWRRMTAQDYGVWDKIFEALEA